MGFLINQNFLRRTVGNKGFKDCADMRTFDAAGQFSIRKSAGAAFTELHVGIRYKRAAFLHGTDVIGAGFHRFPTLNQDRTRTGTGQCQGREKAGRAGSDNQSRGSCPDHR